ncbi:MAG TPA: SH3 domain-containing protein [Candidatus Cloacimonadota bacterium]|nr:SH3 domain-containing protein [Candidatus Cloacimonadota bacterium]HPT71497.1 SH3 domain-containing protein [Candidatus Cloacimonadota bacterium]
MDRNKWLWIWLILLIAAGVALYPWVIRAFMTPTIVVQVVDQKNAMKPVTEGSVYLFDVYNLNIPVEKKLVDNHGKASFKIRQLPSSYFIIYKVSPNDRNTSLTSRVAINRHSGFTRVRLLKYADKNQNNAANPQYPAPVDTTMTSANQSSSQGFYPSNPYITIYDLMRVRSTPSLDGKVLAVLSKNEVVDNLNEVSSQKSLITLQNQPMLSTWTKVKTQKGVVGWVVTVALEQYYEGDGD